MREKLGIIVFCKSHRFDHYTTELCNSWYLDNLVVDLISTSSVKYGYWLLEKKSDKNRQ